MSEGKKQNSKNCTRLAVTSVLLGVAGFLLFPALVIINRPKFNYFLGYRHAWIPAVLGLSIGMVAIAKSKELGQMTGLRTARVGLVLTALVAMLSLFVPPKISFALRMVCGTHMSALGNAMTSFADKNGGAYPDPNKWCDQLLEKELAATRHFLCVPRYTLKYLGLNYSKPKPELGKCHFAMNAKCRPDSSPDTVLLFESTLGWNKHGGPELLTLDNHNGNGCHIAFNDGHVAFERHPIELNWGIPANE